MNNKILIHLIAAARPNFMKIAPLYHALKNEDWADPRIVHTGQHYDLNMSDVFFQDLGLPEPHLHLGIGSGSHAEQTGQVMIAYEKILLETRPDLIIVVGDVNSTMACTIAATKVTYPQPTTQASVLSPRHFPRPIVAHLEAGLRSFDRTMPEEINRLVTDALADILWTPSPDGDAHLTNQGVPSKKIVRVGNIMIDSLEMLREKIEAAAAYREFGLEPGQYGMVTLHRPSNVDDKENLNSLCRLLVRMSEHTPLAFPVHPRTRKSLMTHGLVHLLENDSRIQLLEPQSYVRFMSLVFNCRFVITDSGGVQEETSYLGIPCFTIRPNTERPVTITNGTNRLCTLNDIEEQVNHVLHGARTTAGPIEFWDGKTADRVVESIRKAFSVRA
ncbi:MAG: UDP-N-acetylglucosamine 2-epimerase (non-hydrolyzing) [Desulfobacterales bacterium]|jgi:UDP-N-acetylglucosamine 2-epimerase (non-hydrolysing)|nr:UDP-N-acetylglucosamine 2-epimerase (non-hydrolyzing) [Desulfobacterales bacterium]